MRTLDELRPLAEKALVNIAKKAEGIKNGIVLPGKRVTPKKRSQDEVEDVEIEVSAKKSALGGLNYEYVLWGQSQKIQVAGALASALLHHSLPRSCRCQGHRVPAVGLQ
jgi:hypothetical protein